MHDRIKSKRRQFPSGGRHARGTHVVQFEEMRREGAGGRGMCQKNDGSVFEKGQINISREHIYESYNGKII
jgi:coproporphyrinogen III oxidase